MIFCGFSLLFFLLLITKEQIQLREATRTQPGTVISGPFTVQQKELWGWLLEGACNNNRCSEWVELVSASATAGAIRLLIFCVAGNCIHSITVGASPLSVSDVPLYGALRALQQSHFRGCLLRRLATGTSLWVSAFGGCGMQERPRHSHTTTRHPSRRIKIPLKEIGAAYHALIDTDRSGRGLIWINRDALRDRVLNVAYGFNFTFRFCVLLIFEKTTSESMRNISTSRLIWIALLVSQNVLVVINRPWHFYFANEKCNYLEINSINKPLDF